MTPPLASEARQAPGSGRNLHKAPSQPARVDTDRFLVQDTGSLARWPQDRLSDLGTKLASLKYLLPFDAHSADLIERLFNDLVRLVETNKNILVEVRQLKERNIQLNGTLAQRNTQPPVQASAPVAIQSESAEVTSRMFRLSRLSESLLVILTSMMRNGKAAPTDWTGGSVSLLSLLLSYEKQLATETEGERGVREYPPFLKEFHTVWKAHEERDELREKVAQKDREIATLLTGSNAAGIPASTSSCPKCVHENHERAILKVVEDVRARVETPEMGVGAESLVAELQKARAAVIALEEEKESLSEHARKLEKKMAALLKRQEDLRETQPQEAVPPSNESGEALQEGHRTRHQIFSHHEAEAFEEAREAWKSEKRTLEMTREEKSKQLEAAKRRLATMDADMEIISRKYARAQTQLDKANEAVEFFRNRLTYFEKAEVERMITEEERVKEEAERAEELEELREELAAKQQALTEQTVKVDEIGRALVVKDGQYNALSRDRDDLVHRVRKLTEETTHITRLYENLQIEFKAVENTNQIVTERFNKLQEEIRVLSQENATMRAHLSDEQIVNQQNNDGATQLAHDLQAALQVKDELERQLTNLMADREAYIGDALQARTELHQVTQHYESLLSRYNAVLSEMESASPRPEEAGIQTQPAEVDTVASPDTAGSGGYPPPTQENLTAPRAEEDTPSVLRRERDAFRQARDRAIVQKEEAVKRVMQAELLIKQQTAQLSSLTNTCNLLQHRVRNYAKRCQIMEEIIGKQRNHILSRVQEGDPVPEEVTVALPPATPGTQISLGSVVSLSPNLADLMLNAIPRAGVRTDNSFASAPPAGFPIPPLDPNVYKTPVNPNATIAPAPDIPERDEFVDAEESPPVEVREPEWREPRSMAESVVESVPQPNEEKMESSMGSDGHLAPSLEASIDRRLALSYSDKSSIDVPRAQVPIERYTMARPQEIGMGSRLPEHNAPGADQNIANVNAQMKADAAVRVEVAARAQAAIRAQAAFRARVASQSQTEAETEAEARADAAAAARVEAAARAVAAAEEDRKMSAAAVAGPSGTQAVDYLISRNQGQTTLSDSGIPIYDVPDSAGCNKLPLRDPFEVSGSSISRDEQYQVKPDDPRSTGSTPIPTLNLQEYPWYGGCFRDAHEHPEILQRVMRQFSIPAEHVPEIERMTAQAFNELRLDERRWNVLHLMVEFNQCKGRPVPEIFSPVRQLSHSVHTPPQRTVWYRWNGRAEEGPLLGEDLQRLIIHAYETEDIIFLTQRRPIGGPLKWIFVPHNYRQAHPFADLKRLGYAVRLARLTEVDNPSGMGPEWGLLVEVPNMNNMNEVMQSVEEVRTKLVVDLVQEQQGPPEKERVLSDYVRQYGPDATVMRYIERGRLEQQGQPTRLPNRPNRPPTYPVDTLSSGPSHPPGLFSRPSSAGQSHPPGYTPDINPPVPPVSPNSSVSANYTDQGGHTIIAENDHIDLDSVHGDIHDDPQFTSSARVYERYRQQTHNSFEETPGQYQPVVRPSLQQPATLPTESQRYASEEFRSVSGESPEFVEIPPGAEFTVERNAFYRDDQGFFYVDEGGRIIATDRYMRPLQDEGPQESSDPQNDSVYIERVVGPTETDARIPDLDDSVIVSGTYGYSPDETRGEIYVEDSSTDVNVRNNRHSREQSPVDSHHEIHRDNEPSRSWRESQMAPETSPEWRDKNSYPQPDENYADSRAREYSNIRLINGTYYNKGPTYDNYGAQVDKDNAERRFSDVSVERSSDREPGREYYSYGEREVDDHSFVSRDESHRGGEAAQQPVEEFSDDASRHHQQNNYYNDAAAEDVREQYYSDRPDHYDEDDRGGQYEEDYRDDRVDDVGDDYYNQPQQGTFYDSQRSEDYSVSGVPADTVDSHTLSSYTLHRAPEIRPESHYAPPGYSDRSRGDPRDIGLSEGPVEIVSSSRRSPSLVETLPSRYTVSPDVTYAEDRHEVLGDPIEESPDQAQYQSRYAFHHNNEGYSDDRLHDDQSRDSYGGNDEQSRASYNRPSHEEQRASGNQSESGSHHYEYVGGDNYTGETGQVAPLDASIGLESSQTDSTSQPDTGPFRPRYPENITVQTRPPEVPRLPVDRLPAFVDTPTIPGVQSDSGSEPMPPYMKLLKESFERQAATKPKQARGRNPLPRDLEGSQISDGSEAKQSDKSTPYLFKKFEPVNQNQTVSTASFPFPIPVEALRQTALPAHNRSQPLATLPSYGRPPPGTQLWELHKTSLPPPPPHQPSDLNDSQADSVTVPAENLDASRQELSSSVRESDKALVWLTEDLSGSGTDALRASRPSLQPSNDSPLAQQSLSEQVMPRLRQDTQSSQGSRQGSTFDVNRLREQMGLRPKPPTDPIGGERRGSTSRLQQVRETIRAFKSTLSDSFDDSRPLGNRLRPLNPSQVPTQPSYGHSQSRSHTRSQDLSEGGQENDEKEFTRVNASQEDLERESERSFVPTKTPLPTKTRSDVIDIDSDSGSGKRGRKSSTSSRPRWLEDESLLSHGSGLDLTETAPFVSASRYSQNEPMHLRQYSGASGKGWNKDIGQGKARGNLTSTSRSQALEISEGLQRALMDASDMDNGSDSRWRMSETSGRASRSTGERM